MKTILVTGSKGQLGHEIQNLVDLNQYTDYKFLFTDVEELDITDKAAVGQFFTMYQPDYLINCAAYTAVDQAEEDVELSYKINENAVAILGEVTAKHDTRMIHISTDYVFDGKSYIPYTENVEGNPTTVYGKSKLAGEKVLLKVNPKAVIIRTSWLYSLVGNNFVKTMLRLGNEREQLTVIFDQIGTPTYAADLASAIMQIITAENFVPGIYHFSNEGVCSWYDFATTIFKLKGIKTKVIPIESKDYPVRTPRPYYSVLNKAKIKATYTIQVAHWEEALGRCLKLL